MEMSIPSISLPRPLFVNPLANVTNATTCKLGVIDNELLVFIAEECGYKVIFHPVYHLSAFLVNCLQVFVMLMTILLSSSSSHVVFRRHMVLCIALGNHSSDLP